MHSASALRQAPILTLAGTLTLARYDTDGNGTISAEEFITAKAANKEFNKGDADGDGKMTREEWVQKFGNDDKFDMCAASLLLLMLPVAFMVPTMCCSQLLNSALMVGTTLMEMALFLRRSILPARKPS